MRMLTITQDTDLQALSGLLLDARLGSARTDAAIDALQAVNPHADLKKLRAGTVLFVPETSGFKGSASVSVQGNALGDFQQMVRNVLGQAAEKLKAGDTTRAGERDAITAVIGTAAVKRILDSDPELMKQVTEETKAFEEDQKQADQAEQALAAASRAVLAKLSELSKLLG
jgi:hypothetical protein